MDETQAAAYLAAMIDGEGWIGEYRNASNRAIRIANTEFELIDAIAECCDALGVTYHIYDRAARKQNWSPIRWLEIYGRDNLATVLARVPIRSERKRARLERIVASYRPPIDPDQLRALYLGEGLSIAQTAERLGVGVKRVRFALRTNGISGHQGMEKARLIWETRRRKHGPTGRR
jgi:hypothetical protein